MRAMKKLTQIFLFASIVALLFTSCASDKDENGKNFIKMIETTENGVSKNSVFTYNENKIISTDNSAQNVVYTYTDGLITKVVNYNKQSKLSVTLNYEYLKEKLVKVTSSEDYLINYTYNSDGTVSYEKNTVDSKNKENKEYHGTLSFKNENLVKDERVFDAVSSNTVSSSKTTFEYDAYNNPYSAILGYDKLLDQGVAISKNNVVRTVAETAVVENGQTISSANLYSTTFKYDSDNYPIEQVSESSAMNPNYLKIQYLY